MRRFFQLSLSLLMFFQIQSVFASDTLHAFYFNGESEFIRRFNASLVSFARTRHADIKQYDAKNSASLQLNQVYSTISSKDPLIINLVNVNFASEAVYHARSYHNRVIFFNRKPDDRILNSYDRVWFVGTSPIAAGRYQFEVIYDYLKEHKNWDRNNNGVLDIIILQGQKGLVDTEGRTSQILTRLEDKNIKYSIISDNHDNWESLTAFQDVQAQVKRVGIGNIDMIIANNDSMAVGAVDYLNTEGYNLGKEAKDKSKYIPVFGVDGIPDAIEYIRQNKMAGTVFADFTAMAKVITDIALSDSTDDAELTKKIWYKVAGHKVTIPFIKYSSFKKYSNRSR